MPAPKNPFSGGSDALTRPLKTHLQGWTLYPPQEISILETGMGIASAPKNTILPAPKNLFLVEPLIHLIQAPVLEPWQAGCNNQRRTVLDAFLAGGYISSNRLMLALTVSLLASIDCSRAVAGSRLTDLLMNALAWPSSSIQNNLASKQLKQTRL